MSKKIVLVPYVIFELEVHFFGFKMCIIFCSDGLELKNKLTVNKHGAPQKIQAQLWMGHEK